MKPRKMQPGVMWAVVSASGQRLSVYETRAEARNDVQFWSVPCRVVRVRVTEAP